MKAVQIDNFVSEQFILYPLKCRANDPSAEFGTGFLSIPTANFRTLDPIFAKNKKCSDEILICLEHRG